MNKELYTFPIPFLIFGAIFLLVGFVFPNPITPLIALLLLGLSILGQYENFKIRKENLNKKSNG